MLSLGEFVKIDHEEIKGYAVVEGMVPKGNPDRDTYLVRPLGQKKRVPMYRKELIYVNPFEIMDLLILDKHDKPAFEAFMKQFEGEIVFDGKKGVASKV